MKRVKRVAALTVAVLLCLQVLSGCSKETEELSLSVCVGGAPQTLDPAMAQESGDVTLISHLYENLMQLSRDMSGNPIVEFGMAKDYEVEEQDDGTVTYTFRLRKAEWTDGIAVKADDFVYAWQRLADPATASPNASLLSVIKGYDAVRAGGELSELAVSAENDSTLVVTLSGKYDWFLTDVCTAAATMPLRSGTVESQSVAIPSSAQDAQTIAADSAGMGDEAAATDSAQGAEGTEVRTTSQTERKVWQPNPLLLMTNGAYCIKEYEADHLLLERNQDYYGKATGPEAICFHYADNAEEAWALYEAETVDFVAELPEAQYAELAANENWTPVMDLSVYSVLFNTEAEPFNDPRVREAFSLSIDYDAVVAAAGACAVAAEALVPTGVRDSAEEDFRSVGGSLLATGADSYSERCLTAVALLEEAGYDRGRGFPKVEYLYEAGEKNEAVARAVAAAWSEQLKVSVTLRAVSGEEWSSALSAGEYMLATDAIRGYANDAESFLRRWKSENEDNVIGYSNSAYDTLLSIVENASDEAGRQACLHDAESLLLGDYGVCPLYHSGTAWKLRENLTGLARDARGWFSFKLLQRTV